MSSVASALIGLFLAVPIAVSQDTAHEISIDRWEPAIGDRIIVDTKNNEGFFVHKNGSFVRFPVVTGQHRYVSYIGRYYNAKTPNWDWMAKSMHIKGDRTTFGPSGRFLRLYKDGNLRTAYGFHEHRDEEEMFSKQADQRFRSMGCIIVQTEIMDLLEKTFLLNGKSIDVISQYGIADIGRAVMEYTHSNLSDRILPSSST